MISIESNVIILGLVRVSETTYHMVMHQDVSVFLNDFISRILVMLDPKVAHDKDDMYC